MRRSLLLHLGILACLLTAGLGACVSAPQPLPPKVESSQQTDTKNPEQARQLTSSATAKAEGDQPTATTTLPDPSAEQESRSEPCDQKPPRQGVLAASSDCYQIKPGPKKKGQRGGRCEPQSLPYARCRSGIRSCNLGHENGPLTWFACEQKAGNTSAEPASGSVLILGSIRTHKMKTGHVMYVESASPLTASTSKLILSHTNYDRKCSKETNIEATYNRRAMTLDIHSGAWKAWGQGLTVAGFILR